MRLRTTTAALKGSIATALAMGMAAGIAGTVLAATPANAAEGNGIRFAPAGSAAITPGVQTFTRGGQCTSNFVFTDRKKNLYVGQAAHCSGLGGSTQTNGCQARSLPLGTRVTFNEGGTPATNGTTVGRGTLAYSSWVTMNRINTKNPNACAFNDLALIKVAKKDKRKVNPSVPFWGGPSGIDRNGTSTGQRVFSFGNSSLRGGLAPLSPKAGLSVTTNGGGWNHSLYTLTPGIPGDSGSAFLSQNGQALGVLSTVAIAPLALSNGVSDINKMLKFAQRHSGIKGLRLVQGTRSFDPIL